MTSLQAELPHLTLWPVKTTMAMAERSIAGGKRHSFSKRVLMDLLQIHLHRDILKYASRLMQESSPVICRLRTNAKQRSYTRQLKKELYDIELNQMKALDGIRIHRIFTKDLTVPINLDPLTQEQRYKIETVLDRDW
uniref:Uncharacterized protein n=1 Tax=Timema poppense TaxID=170557 RepID=A0A7R9DMA4_TIMPO|nr:unnamed protein product [Timema poppensis]